MRQIVRQLGLLACGAFALCWLAIYNRYPLLYPDSIGYLKNGRLAALALLFHKFSPQYGGRSLVYCLGILPFHWNRSPWPIVILNAVLTAWVIWLVVASIAPRKTALIFLVVISVLSAFTGLSWFVSLVMPDILGPLLYLAVYLLVFAPSGLSRGTRVGLQLIAWWSIASHASHLILACILCGVLTAVLLLQNVPGRSLARPIGILLAMIALAAVANLALHKWLYGEASLTGKRPPFLMARVIVDGPGLWYLRQNCTQAKLVICAHVSKLHDGMTDDEFLWEPQGIWKSASPEVQDRLRAEEARFVLSAIRAYPKRQLYRSMANFREQMATFGLWDYGPNPYISEAIEAVLPGGSARYLRSRQIRHELPDDFSTTAQMWMIASAIALMGLVVTTMTHFSRRLLGLVAVVISMVFSNALVTGVLSNVEDRYQSRVIWLVPLLAAMFVVERVFHQKFPAHVKTYG